MRHLVLAGFALGALACGSNGATMSPTAPRIHVGGTYDTAVALVEDGCGGVVVMPNPTTVAHEAGAVRLTLTHAANGYDGTLDPDGSFRTDPRTIGPDTLLIAGRFSTSGFDATVTADRAVPCRYVVRWTGTKRGAPNVIP